MIVVPITLKPAVTARLPFMVSIHVYPPAESHPVQLTGELASVGVAVKVMTCPGVNVAEQAPDTQSIPTGLLVMRPVKPGPSCTTKGELTKVAVTMRSPVRVTVQLKLCTSSQPLHPVNTYVPDDVLANNVTTVPALAVPEHWLPQLIGVAPTVPFTLPPPSFVTVSE